MILTRNRREMHKRLLLIVIGILFVGGVFFSTAWWLSGRGYHRIPVTFSTSNTPVIEVSIAGKSYPLELDLGTKSLMSLSKQQLSSIDKTVDGTVEWRDIKGHLYQAPSYKISRVQWGDIVLSDVVAREQSSEFLANVTLWNDEREESVSEEIGALGRPILEKHNLFLNFPDSEVVVCNSFSKLAKMKPSCRWLKIPLDVTPKGVFVQIGTDLGEKRFVIDTGATKSILNRSLAEGRVCGQERHGLDTFTSATFVIGEKDFGSQTLLLIDIASELREFNGLLGMDFLKQHAVYIDYRNHAAYLAL